MHFAMVRLECIQSIMTIRFDEFIGDLSRINYNKNKNKKWCENFWSSVVNSKPGDFSFSDSRMSPTQTKIIVTKHYFSVMISNFDKNTTIATPFHIFLAGEYGSLVHDLIYYSDRGCGWVYKLWWVAMIDVTDQIPGIRTPI